MAFGVPTPQGGAVPFSSLTAPQATPAVPSAIGPLAQAMDAPHLDAKPKMNWLGILADALAGAAGRPGPYAAMMGQQRELQMQQQLAQQNSDRELQRQKEFYQYQIANPRPDDSPTERMIAALVAMPQNDPRRPYYESAVLHPMGVDVTHPDGSVTREFVYPGQQQPQQQPRVFNQLPPDAVPVTDGGQTPPASGTFPKRKRK